MKYIKFIMGTFFKIYLFFGSISITAQIGHKEFEKKYLEFHEKWDNGYDATLSEIDTLFADCPDLTRFPHYFLYKGDLLADLGYEDLSIQHYLVAQKYIDLGYDSNQLEDHSPIVYFKIADSYFNLAMYDKMKKYIDLLKAYNQKNYSFHSEYDSKELLAMYWFHSTNKKEEAIQLLEEIYHKSENYKESPIFKIRNTALLKAINLSLHLKDTTNAKRLLQTVRQNKKWFKERKGYLLRWYYQVNSEYCIATHQLEKALLYNDSICNTKPIKLLHKTDVFNSYVYIYKKLKNPKKATLYKDSLQIILKEKNQKRISSNLRLIEEKKIFEKQISNITKQRDKQRLYWLLSVFLCLTIGGGTIFVFRNRKNAIDKEYNQLSGNYQELLKNYQFTNKQLSIIKNSLLEEVRKQKEQPTNQLYQKITQYDFLKTNEDLLTLDTVRDRFVITIKEQFPTISTVQSLILFYTKTGLTSKEISAMLKLTVRSVESYKYRFSKQVKQEFNLTLKEYLEKQSLFDDVLSS